MKRNLFSTVEEFITNKDLHTFILSGASFVGKTYLCVDLFKSYSMDYLYIDVRSDSSFKRFMSDNNSEIESLEIALSKYFNIPVDTLVKIPVVLDEIAENDILFDFVIKYAEYISEKEDDSNVLKLFIISNQKYDILVNAFSDKNSKSAVLHPMGFDEFLVALGHEWYRDLIAGHFKNRKKIPEMLHQEISGLFDIYMIVGGMPSAVIEYINYEAIINVNNINNNLYQLMLYRFNDTKSSNLLNAIPECLETASKKFLFTKIYKGATISAYIDTISKLRNSNVINITKKLNQNMIDDEIFDKSSRIFYDNFSYIPIKNQKSIESRMYAYINSVLETGGYKYMYSETKGGALIDFVINSKKYGRIPFVVKNGAKSRDKALLAFESEQSTEYTITLSSSNYDFSRKNIQLPFYSIFAFDM